MRARLADAAEVLLGLAWWGLIYAWGFALSAVLILAPLILANLVVELRGDVPATLALAAGVAGAYVLGLPPWDADEWKSLPLVIGGAAVSAVAFDLIRGSADITSLAVALGLTAVGWPIRRGRRNTGGFRRLLG